MPTAVVDIDAELAKRDKARRDRMKAFRDAAAAPMVKVVPTKPEYIGPLRHGTTGVGWKEGGEAVLWPLDQFTRRRIRDGSITVEEDKPKEEKEDKPAKPRSSARASDDAS